MEVFFILFAALAIWLYFWAKRMDKQERERQQERENERTVQGTEARNRERERGRERETEREKRRDREAQTRTNFGACSTSLSGGNQVDGLPPVVHAGVTRSGLADRSEGSDQQK